MLIPANTLIFGKDGPSVATVGPDNKVALKKVKIGADLGTSLEIKQGLSTNDRVILNPAAGLTPGQTVKIRSSTIADPEHLTER
ncbi:MAG TPA: hypothetical protein VGH07_00625 [Chthoniobacterales bacterium]|jgi:hypothetical protein